MVYDTPKRVLVTHLLEKAEKSTHFRKVIHEDCAYYCVTDVFAALLNTNRSKASNYYHVLKRRCLHAKVDLFSDVITLRASATDGKSYETDFIDLDGVQRLYEHLERNLQLRKSRIKSGSDEVVNYHPGVANYLIQSGFEVEHHVTLTSGNVIDFVACRDGITYVIECKPILSKSTFYKAIGQVLCYRAEYDPSATAAIATTSFDEYASTYCNTLNIMTFTIE